jgi:hypothetical protein
VIGPGASEVTVKGADDVYMERTGPDRAGRRPASSSIVRAALKAHLEGDRKGC